MARIEPDAVNPQGKIDPADFHSPSEIDNGAALQLICQDAINTEAWLQLNYFSLRWREADALYQSPPGILLWEGTTVPRSNVNRFVVLETVTALHSQIMNGLFYENPPFVLRPRPAENQNSTRAISSLIATEMDQMKLREETDWGLHSALLFGTAIWQWGFKSYTRKRVKYIQDKAPITVPSAIAGQPDASIETSESLEFRKVTEDEDVYLPTFENKDIRHILVDPGLRTPDIRNAKFVISRTYVTYKDLIRLKDETYYDDASGTLKKRYDLPSEATIKEWFSPPEEQVKMPGQSEALSVQGTTFVHHAAPRWKKTTEDPLDEPLELLERWDNDKVITALQRTKCIRNEANEFGQTPFLSVNWCNIPDAFWGLGLGRIIGVEQRVQAGIINACLDLASLIVNPMWARSRGANIQEQQIRQRIGGIIAVDGPVKDALHMLEQPTIPAEVVQQIGLSEARVEKTSGASQQMTMGASGGAPGTASKGQLGRSGTGASGIIQATMNRIGGFAEMFVRQVYEPLLYNMHQMNKDKMPMSYIIKVLGDKLGPAFKFNPTDFMNAPTEFEVLAGSHLAAKGQMAQSLFMMLQMFENPPIMDQLNKISNKKVNVEELLHMVHDVSGHKNYYDIIVDMTPQEIQAQQQQLNPAAQKLQGQMQVNDQKFQQNSQLVDQENEARVVRDMLRQIAEKSSEPQMLTGGDSTQGFGSQEEG